ncbi:hypothetical protein [Taibaiella chishuiensis]|uniref:Uncharacterized protein n=1 Tax=Taibaiella chishuiensis TaxID=1434707 RepID=A0A2P8DCL3_9BACT|nr:hypothetical protein [Taibaiella chishuiensis]PSK94952.1 hypothetical protein B0I18_1011115 [Taibaiella chishuiensis]
MQQISNRQLYALLQNERLESSLRLHVQWLWDQRRITTAEEQQLAAQYRSLFLPATALKKRYILLALVFPFVVQLFFIQAFISARLLACGNRKKWYPYWRAVCAGYLLYLALLLTLACIYIFP